MSARDPPPESIQPGKRPLDAELSLYESCHALRSAIALDGYNCGRAHTEWKCAIAALQDQSYRETL
jgi:hypothetical protein